MGLVWLFLSEHLLQGPVNRLDFAFGQVLRNRILGVEAGFKSRAWQSEQRRIMAKIQRVPCRNG